MRSSSSILFILSLAAFAIPVFSNPNATVPGEVSCPYPTLHNLAVEWNIEGDENRDCSVAVRYRKLGQESWKEAMPLVRVAAGGPIRTFQWANKLSGSIFNLIPDTEYEVALHLEDPDGGEAKQEIVGKTRAMPVPMAGARVVRVNKYTLREEAAKAAPGTIFKLAPGAYDYFEVPCDGVSGKPIIFMPDENAYHGGRDIPAEENPKRGDSLFRGISLQDRSHVILDGLVSHGTIDLFNAEDCVVKNCRVYAPFGIITSWTSNMGKKWSPEVGTRLRGGPQPEKWNRRERIPEDLPPHAINCIITDNTVIGLTPWAANTLGPANKNIGEGIEVSGKGLDICYNYVRGFRDCISTVEGTSAVEQVCIDIYNNDIEFGTDEGIEADYCMSNCRIYNNRITNCNTGLSSQPALGGPVYFIRNVHYNLLGMAYKFYNNSDGNIVWHNTVVKSGTGAACFASAAWSNSIFRNNLTVGSAPLSVSNRRDKGWAAYFGGADSSCDFDFNGYGVVGVPFAGNIAGQEFDSLESLRKNTTEKNSVQVGLDVFRLPISIPDEPFKEYHPPDLRLATRSPAIDAGVALPNINDDFRGSAPDLGAYEQGDKLPHYGPRPRDQQ